MRLVYSLAAFDTATRVASSYFKPLPEVTSGIYKVVECIGGRARRECVYPNIGGSTLVAVGHGDPYRLTGHNRETILARCDRNVPTIALVYSCNTALILGRDMVSKGCRVYWGWDDVVYVGKPGTPTEWLSRSIAEAWGMLLLGYTDVAGAYDYVKSRMLEMYESLKRVDPELAYQYLHNVRHMKLYGDRYYRFFERPVARLEMVVKRPNLAPIILGGIALATTVAILYKRR